MPEELVQTRVVGLRQHGIFKRAQVALEVLRIGGTAQHSTNSRVHSGEFVGSARYGIHVSMNQPIKGLPIRYCIRRNETPLL